MADKTCPLFSDRYTKLSTKSVSLHVGTEGRAIFDFEPTALFSSAAGAGGIVRVLLPAEAAHPPP